MTSSVKLPTEFVQGLGKSGWLAEPSEETEPVTATVDHADIRGLVTTLLVSVARLLRSRDECLKLITSSKVAR